MTTHKDISYGVIPVRRVGVGWEVLLIRQYSRIGNNTYWILPKGHAESGESPIETAIRELKEETGLVAAQILEKPTFTLQYQFAFEGKEIDKTVVFFVGVISDHSLDIDTDEVREAYWCSLPDAIKRLDYDGAKTMMKNAKQYIETSLEKDLV